MSHKLHRLTSSLYNTPLLIEQNAFKGILHYLSERNINGIKSDSEFDDDCKSPDDCEDFIYNADTQTGLIELIGPLTAKPITMMGFDCGGANYQDLKQSFETLIQLGAKTIAMIVDSPGGDAYSMSDSANYIRQILDANGVQLITFVEGMAASAGYGIACISDEIYGSWDSEAGSIGCLVQLMNNSKNLEMNGYERTFVSAGSQKIPYSEDGSFREEFLKDIQSKVDLCYKNFTEHVANHRGLPLKSVVDTEARMYFAGEAVTLGLMDGVKTQEEFFTYLATVSQRNGDEQVNKLIVDRMNKFMNKTEVSESMKLEEMQAALIEKEALLSSNQEAISALTASVEQLQSQLQASAEALTKATAAVAEMEKAKAEAAVASRKTQLSEVLAADQVEANFAALAGLDDASFGVVLGQFKAVKEARAASFAALGSDAAVELEEQKESQPDGAEAIRLAGVARAKALAGKR